MGEHLLLTICSPDLIVTLLYNSIHSAVLLGAPEIILDPEAADYIYITYYFLLLLHTLLSLILAVDQIVK